LKHLSAKSAYMRDQTFQGIIGAIPVLIILVFILLPFSSNGWDVGKTVLPANPFGRPGTDLLSGLRGGGQALAGEGPMLSVRDSGVSGDGSRYFLEVQLRNPLPMKVDVKEFTAGAPVGSARVALSMAGTVSIPSGGSAVCRLEGAVPPGLSVKGAPIPSASDLEDLRMTISSGGVEMTLDEDTIRGMLS
jgi:hypothetical protein